MDNQPKERILVHITADPSTAILIRRGRRVADYLHADCTALFVHLTPELSQLSAEERQAHSQVGLLELLRGNNFTEDIVRLAQDLQVTVAADRSHRQTLQ